MALRRYAQTIINSINLGHMHSCLTLALNTHTHTHTSNPHLSQLNGNEGETAKSIWNNLRNFEKIFEMRQEENKKKRKKTQTAKKRVTNKWNENRFFLTFFFNMKTRDTQMIRIVKCGVTFTFKNIFSPFKAQFVRCVCVLNRHFKMQRFN